MSQILHPASDEERRREGTPGSASSAEGFYNTPIGSLILKRKGAKGTTDESGDSSAPSTSALGTPVSGRKRKKTPPGGPEEGGTALAKAKLGHRGLKTPRTSDAESAAEVEKPLLLPPPRPSTSSSQDPCTQAPEGRGDHLEEPRVIGKTIVMDNDGNEVSDDGARPEDEEGAEYNSSSLDLLRSLKVGERAKRDLRKWKSEPLPKGRGRGRPPTSGDYVGYADANTKTVESRMREVDARFIEDVTSKLSSAAIIYGREGTIEGVPLGEIGTSIAEALEGVYMVSKVSKGLKGNMVGRLRAAVDIIRSGSEELQRRLIAQVRDSRGTGAMNEELAACRRRAFIAEAQVQSLSKQLKEERMLHFAEIEERPACPPSRDHEGEMEVEALSKVERRRSLSPLPQRQRTTRAMAKEKALAVEGKKDERRTKAQTSTSSSSP